MAIFRAALADEIKYLLGQKRLLLILFGLPLFYGMVFGFLYINHKVREIPVVVFDQDNSKLSRELTSYYDLSETFQVTGKVFSQKDLEVVIAREEAMAGIVIPQGFSAKVSRGESSPVLTVVDGANMIIANAVIRGANEITQTLSYGIAVRVLELNGMMPKKAGDLLSALSFRTRIWYNPTFNYTNFLLLGLLGAVLQQGIFMAISMAFTAQGRRLAGGSWKDISCRAWGRLLPYLASGLIAAGMVYPLAVKGFGVPFRGSVFLFLGLTMVFLGAVLGLAFLVAVLVREPLEALQYSMLIAMPSFLLSGYTWPLTAMPSFLQGIAKALPLTYYLHGIRNLFLKGNGLEMVANDLIFLGLLALASISLAIVLSRNSLSAENSVGEIKTALP